MYFFFRWKEFLVFSVVEVVLFEINGYGIFVELKIVLNVYFVWVKIELERVIQWMVGGKDFDYVKEIF